MCVNAIVGTFLYASAFSDRASTRSSSLFNVRARASVNLTASALSRASMLVAPRWMIPPAFGHWEAYVLISAMRSWCITFSISVAFSISMSSLWASSSSTCSLLTTPAFSSALARAIQTLLRSFLLWTSEKISFISSEP